MAMIDLPLPVLRVCAVLFYLLCLASLLCVALAFRLPSAKTVFACGLLTAVLTFPVATFLPIYFGRLLYGRSTESQIRFFLSLPAWMIGLLAALSVVAVVLMLLRLWRLGKRELTAQSLCEGLDQLPDGISYSLPDGFPKLVNSRMQAISNAAFGVGVTDTRRLDERLQSRDLLPGCTVDEETNNMFLRLPDGTVWHMKQQQVETNGQPMAEMLAYDVTERYNDLVELRQRNETLEKVNHELRGYLDNMNSIVREREVLAAKTRLHNEVGQSLLAIEAYLKESDGDREALMQQLRQTILLLQSDVPDEQQDRIPGSDRCLTVLMFSQHRMRVLLAGRQIMTLKSTGIGCGASITKTILKCFIFRISITFDASLVNPAAGSYATNTENAFAEIGGEKIASFAVPEKVTVAADRNIVVFKINGEIYSVEEGRLGDVITAPVTDLATWNIADGTKITGSYAAFEAAELSSDNYTVTWDIDGVKSTEPYTFGSKIQVPAVADKDDLDFAGFTPAVPHIMPAKDLTFTAVYAPKHVHNFKQTGYKGVCTEGLTIVSTCVCGETKEVKSDVRNHQFRAVVGDVQGNKLTDTLVCDVCGASEQHTLTFKTRNNGYGKTYLDLSLEKEGTLIQPASGSSVRIMIPWTNQGYSNTNVRVYRVNEAGVQKIYTPTLENGYLVFEADHFSMYVVEELDGSTTPDPVSYEVAVCDLNGTHSYTDTVTPPTCTEKGYTTHTCQSCGETYTDSEVAAKGHAYGNWTKLNDTQHQRVCANDPSHVEKADHTWDNGKQTKAATCTQPGTKTFTCTACGATRDETIKVDPNAHNLTFVPENKATTEAEGNVAYYHCTLCGKNFSDKNGSKELTKVTTDKLQPTEPEKPQRDPNACKWCGKVHNGFFQKIVGFFHSILAAILGARY